MRRRELIKTIAAAGVTSLACPMVIKGLEYQDIDPEDGRAAKSLDRLRGEPPASASVEFERGGLRLYVNGREQFPLMCVSTNLLATAKSYRASGIRFFHPLIGLDDGWTGPGRYDWRRILAYFGRLLAIVPDAFFLPRLHLNAPLWWKDANPEELIGYALSVEASGHKMPPRRIDSGFNWNTIVDTHAASLASAKWRMDVAAALRDFIRAVEQSPLRSRVIGYHVAGGLNGEWHYTGSRFLPDTSSAMARLTGSVPGADARRTTTSGLLRDPAVEKDVIRFYRKFHESVADAALLFCRVVKEETRGRLLAGIFYGYLLENVMIQEAGHLAPKRVLASPDVDFIAAPYSYIHTTQTKTRPRWESDVYDEAGNWLGRARGVSGDGGLRVMAESLRRHRKLFMSEMDSSTYLEPVRSTEGGSGNDTLEGTLRILRRDLGQVFATGIGGWLFDFGHFDPPYKARRGWYDDLPMIEEIRAWSELGEKRKEFDLSPVAEIAAVYSPDSFFVTRHWTAEAPWEGYGVSIMDIFDHWFLAAQSRSIHRIGAPVDFLYDFDLNDKDTQKYKLLLFPNLFYLTRDEQDRLRRVLRGSGATVVWYYAPGYVAPDRLDLEQMESLTGFKFRIIQEPGPLIIRCEMGEGSRPLRTTFGIRKEYFPRFAVDDRDQAIRVLGRWEDRRDVSFARKEYDGFTSVYVGAAPLPVEVLRRLAEEAGVLLWSSKPDVVRATHDAAMIIAADDGERVIRFPQPFWLVRGGAPAALEHRLEMKFGDVLAFIRSYRKS
jgi:hypothetical protein